MKLSDRKKKILQIVVSDYIASAQPVSSKSITEKHMTDVSSATVRSELSALEDMGYLLQLHTSSGRVPSSEAYKLYVNELMEKGKLTPKELKFIKDTFNTQANNLETVVKNTVKVISELTDYTSLAYTVHDEADKIEDISIFRYKPDLALLLIVTDKTLIRDKFIEIPKEMTDDQIDNANKLMKKMFAGKQFKEILVTSEKMKSEFDSYREIFSGIIDAIENYIKTRAGEVVMEGEDRILKYPEYSSVEKVKDFLSVVTSKEKLADILESDDKDIEIQIKIGSETDESIPEDCSLVTATYMAGGVKLGTYGVIGPVRMDYKKVISVLESVGKILQDILNDE